MSEADLIYYGDVLHSKPLTGYCGAVMIYGMLYETAPNTAAIGASYCGVSKELAQQVEDATLDSSAPILSNRKEPDHFGQALLLLLINRHA